MSNLVAETPRRAKPINKLIRKLLEMLVASVLLSDDRRRAGGRAGNYIELLWREEGIVIAQIKL